MTDFDHRASHRRKRSELEPEQWEALLSALGPERDAAGEKYEELRRRLINLFAWEQCDSPENLADEVLNRLARKVKEGVAIPHLDRYAFGIARIVIQEQVRLSRNRQASIRELQSTGAKAAHDLAMLDRMQGCIDALSTDRRDLIEGYYAGNREALARKLGISINALRNRALRIREELFRCMSQERDES